MIYQTPIIDRYRKFGSFGWSCRVEKYCLIVSFLVWGLGVLVVINWKRMVFFLRMDPCFYSVSNLPRGSPGTRKRSVSIVMMRVYKKTEIQIPLTRIQKHNLIPILFYLSFESQLYFYVIKKIYCYFPCGKISWQSWIIWNFAIAPIRPRTCSLKYGMKHTPRLGTVLTARFPVGA